MRTYVSSSGDEVSVSLDNATQSRSKGKRKGQKNVSKRKSSND